MSSQPLHIFPNLKTGNLPEVQLQQLTRTVYKREGVLLKKEVNCIFCSDYRIRKLNRTYRQKDRVTDVLSFPFSDDDFLGEIYISVRRAEVQARRYGFTRVEELLRLYLHGLLHLAGYDHLETCERDQMEKKERLYLKKLFSTL